MAANETAYRVLHLEEAALSAGEGNGGAGSPGFRHRRVRREAVYQGEGAASPVIGEARRARTLRGRRRELYVVSKAAARSRRGRRVDAPEGTAVFVGDPGTCASLRARTGRSSSVGGKRGEAFR